MTVENEGDLKQFTVHFFNNLKCDTLWENEVLIVDKVPQGFEELFGKKAPYHLVFDRSKENEHTELVARGSSLLKVMAMYLEHRGETTLLKILFEVDPKKLIEQTVRLQNCEIGRVNSSEQYKPILRFTFLTTLQYLNEKENIMTSLYVADGQIINFDDSKYKTIEGKKEDLSVKDIKKEYAVAKEKLKEIISPRIQEVGLELKNKLELEIQRVKDHHSHQSGEIDEEMKNNEKQIAQLEKQKFKAKDELAKNNIDAKIEKLKEETVQLQNNSLRDKIQKEEAFFIQDEVHKHSLNLDTKLMNTTIFYYPLFSFDALVQNKQASRHLPILFNPLARTMSDVQCEGCKKQIRDVVLCSGGHISCDSCMRTCGDCREQFCITCLSRSCACCGKKLCKKCALKCSKCGKTVCREHIHKNAINARHMCMNCLTNCPSCGSFVEREQLKKCARCGHQQCEKCARQEMIRTRGQSSCKSCSKF
jgi:hypothetical protein